MKLEAEEKYLSMVRESIGRKISREPAKTYRAKESSKFFDTYMKGFGLDVGYKGGDPLNLPIRNNSVGVDLGYPGYDGVNLPFKDCSQDFVYSSHCLEHVLKPFEVIRDWYRVTKVGGFIVIVVPHQYLYEKKAVMPSRFAREHLRFFTPSKLLEYVETALIPNSYRVKFLEDGDLDFDYTIPPTEHSVGQYEITLVLQKINPPKWQIE